MLGKLIQNTKYEVVFQLDNQRKPRTFIGTYMGDDVFGHAQFNMRPTAGTGSLRREYIIKVRPVDRRTPHTQPSIVR
jgi:hypothetical protein